MKIINPILPYWCYLWISDHLPWTNDVPVLWHIPSSVRTGQTLNCTVWQSCPNVRYSNPFGYSIQGSIKRVNWFGQSEMLKNWKIENVQNVFASMKWIRWVAVLSGVFYICLPQHRTIQCEPWYLWAVRFPGVRWDVSLRCIQNFPLNEPVG